MARNKSDPGTRPRRTQVVLGVMVALAMTLVVTACGSATDEGTPSEPLIADQTRDGDDGSASAIDPAGEDVTLGLPEFAGQRGYGEAEPDEIHNGGDPTGIVEDISWQSWGEEIAVGSGLGYYHDEAQAVADALQEPATVVAFDLGQCHGQLAYRSVQWYFPEKADQQIDTNHPPLDVSGTAVSRVINICPEKIYDGGVPGLV